MAAVGHDENLFFVCLRVYTCVIPLISTNSGMWNSFLILF